MTNPEKVKKDKPGDGCRTALQRQKYPAGRTRFQLIGSGAVQGQIIAWLRAHDRSKRHRAIWMLLVAGWNALTDTFTKEPPMIQNRVDRFVSDQHDVDSCTDIPERGTL